MMKVVLAGLGQSENIDSDILANTTIEALMWLLKS